MDLRRGRRLSPWLWLALLPALAFVVLAHDDFGINWDEPVQSTYGDLVREWFVSGGADRRCDEFLNLRYYGPLLDLLPAVLHPERGPGRYSVRHLLCGLLAVALLAALIRHAGRFADRRLPWFALLSLATMPRFVGHACHNLKDIPFALAVTLLMGSIAALAIDREVGRARCWRFGLLLGFGLCVRPGGLPLFVLLVLAGLMISDLLRGRRRPLSLRQVAGFLGGAFLIGYLLMVLPWPFAWQNPVLHPLTAMAMAQRFHYSPEVLFAGEVLRSVDLPRSYPIRFLCIATPPTTLLLAMLGVAATLHDLWRRPRARGSVLGAVTLTWLVLPLAALWVAHPNVYDGMRHILFVLPALAVLAALGAARLVRIGGQHRRQLRSAFALLLLLAPVPDLIRLHPYQMTYFNRFVGGLQRAAARYETDYWVLSYQEAFAWVNAQAALRPRLTVLVAGSGYLTPLVELYRAPNVEAAVIEEIGNERELPAGVDFLIATSRFGYAERLFPAAPIVHSIGRDGAVFTVIRGR